MRSACDRIARIRHPGGRRNARTTPCGTLFVLLLVMTNTRGKRLRHRRAGNERRDRNGECEHGRQRHPPQDASTRHFTRATGAVRLDFEQQQRPAVSCAGPNSRRDTECEVDEDPHQTDPRENEKGDAHASHAPLSSRVRAKTVRKSMTLAYIAMQHTGHDNRSADSANRWVQVSVPQAQSRRKPGAKARRDVERNSRDVRVMKRGG